MITNFIESLIDAADPAYKRWLSANPDDVSLLDDATALFGKRSLHERNESYQVQAWLPTYLMIRQEGDLAYVMEASANGPIYSVDLGGLSVDELCEIAPSFSVWERDGFPLPRDTPYRLPFVADIYVSGIPSGDLVVLMRMKKFLNAAWPASMYRQLLLEQPFLALVAGHPIALERRLENDSSLSPFLFWAAPEGLKRIVE